MTTLTLVEKQAVINHFIEIFFSHEQVQRLIAWCEKEATEVQINEMYEKASKYFVVRAKFELIKDDILTGPPVTDEELKNFLQNHQSAQNF